MGDAGTRNLDGGKWYVVNGVITVTRAEYSHPPDKLEVVVGEGGAANLVLLDRASFTVPGGIRLPRGRALNVFGVSSGALISTGSWACAGIGGGGRNQEAGTLTVYGGTVKATGGSHAAGIGGGDMGKGGAVTIRGGTVTATGGGGGGAGIGGGCDGVGGQVSVSGGHVTATGVGGEGGFGNNSLWMASGATWIFGGKVAVYDDDLWGGFPVRGSLWLGPNVFKIDDNHYQDGVRVHVNPPSYLRLVSAVDKNGAALQTSGGVFIGPLSVTIPRATLTFDITVPGYRFTDSNMIRVGPFYESVTLSPDDLPQVRRAALSLVVPDHLYLSAASENGTKVEMTTRDGITYLSTFPNSGRVTLTFAPSDVGYRLTGPNVITVGPIEEDITLSANDLPKAEEDLFAGPVEYLLADGSVTSTTGVRRINQATSQRDTLSSGWYMMTGEMTTSALNVRGTVNLILADGETLTVNGGIQVDSGNTLNIFCQREATGKLVANGNRYCAGIGGANPNVRAGRGNCGTVTIAGGLVTATGGRSAAGIGTGYLGNGGTLTIDGGTVTASGAVDIGGGGVNVTIDGGSVSANSIDQPKNAANAPVYRVIARVEGLKVQKLAVEGLGNYGTSGIYSFDNCVCLYLPDGGHHFTISDGETAYRYCAVVKGRNVTVMPLPTCGFLVNGADIGDKSGDGWAYEGSVLSLTNAQVYVLSGAAVSNEVQVKVAAQDATVVLSNAVVFTEGRPALDVGGNASLLMAGGTSCLAATNESAAVSVAAGAALSVNRASGADEAESMIGVFNYGNAKAISNAGRVAVDGGTLFAWSDGQAVETPGAFTFGEGEVLMTGETPEAMSYVRECNNKPCVLVGPGVTVTVKDIPHVADFTVSNAVQEIERIPVSGGAAYRVMPGDDVFVGYAMEEGYTSKSANPLAYPAVGGDITVDANTIRIEPTIPYRAWNEKMRRMEDCVCTNYTVVTAETTVFESNKWYVVRDSVSSGKITVRGLAHLILCDGATLTANGGEWEPGVEVRGENALHIYGQAGGTGALVANGGYGGSGIGGGDGGGAAGIVTIDGGTVTAHGGYNGAGIGGGNQDAGGTVTINGGIVTASGIYGAGIGGGYRGGGGTVTINGGTVTATGGYGGADIGGGYRSGGGAIVTINGGSVKASTIKDAPGNVGGDPLYSVIAKCEGIRDQGSGIRLEGLGEYGANDVYPVGGTVYLWLPDGTHRFSLSDGTTTNRYYAVVKGKNITVEPLAPVGFLVNGVDIGTAVEGEGWEYDRDDRILGLNAAGPYALSGAATNDEVQVMVAQVGATVVLSNTVVFTENRPALIVNGNASLLMAGGASFLGTTNESAAVAVAAGVALTVGLEPGADASESMIGVFNYGDAKAISGSGTVAVNGGTLAVWADVQSVEKPECFTCGTGEVMMTGETPETLRYVGVFDANSCVLVGPGVTVTVKDIPHVTGFAVSNAVEEIGGTPVEGGSAYRVVLGEDVYVGYTLEEGCASKSANPLVYTDVTNDITVDANEIQIAPTLPYRAWNEETQQMEARECANYEVVTSDTTAFGSNRWYVVTNDVTGGEIAVGDSAHLILCDGATLTVNALTGGSLAVYGQSENSGALVASGTVSTALTVVGGNVKAWSVTTPVKNAMGDVVHCVTCEGLESLGGLVGLTVAGLESYGIEKTRLMDGKVYLWLPDGTHCFMLSNGESAYYDYCAEMDGTDITVWPEPPLEPVAPGGRSGPYTTAEEATNVANRAELVPTDEVLEVLETEEALGAYYESFGFAVTGGGEAWFVKSVLTPEAWTNVAESAQAATRQIPLADIAALPTDGKKDVSVTNCVPGFYYTLYGAAGVRALPTTETKYGPKLSGVSGEVTFPEVVKPSDAAGFFSIGAKETPGVQPSDVSYAPITVLK